MMSWKLPGSISMTLECQHKDRCLVLVCDCHLVQGVSKAMSSQCLQQHYINLHLLHQTWGHLPTSRRGTQTRAMGSLQGQWLIGLFSTKDYQH